MKSELGTIKINRPVSRTSIFIIAIIILNLLIFHYKKIALYKMVLFIMFCIFGIVSIKLIIKAIKFIVKKIRKEKSTVKYEPKRLEYIYNAFEKLFFMFSPIGLLFIIEQPIILLLPLLVFLALVFLAIKNYLNSKKASNCPD